MSAVGAGSCLVSRELLEGTAEGVNGAFELLNLGAVGLATALVALVVALFAETLASSAEIAT